MYELIAKKLTELKRNYPDNPKFTKWYRHSDLWNFLYVVEKINGKNPNRGTVAKLVEGKIIENLSFQDYLFASKLKDVVRDMRTCISMQAELRLDMVERWAGMLFCEEGTKKSVLRNNACAVYEWGHIPCSEQILQESLTRLLREYYISRLIEPDPIKNIAGLHLKFDLLYPYGINTPTMAMLISWYCLMEFGCPFPEIPLNDVEYNSMVAGFVDNRNPDEFAEILSMSLVDRLDRAVLYASEADR